MRASTPDTHGALLRLDDRDRGRILLATVITLLALPTIWLVNRSEDGPGSARPNVAAAGLDPGEADAADPETGGTDTSRFDPMGTTGAAYLAPNTTLTPATPPAVAVGTSPDELVAAVDATYQTDDIGGSICYFNGVDSGEQITVVNVANGRSTTCTASYLAGGASDRLVMSVSRFQTIADLVMAPVHVEVRQ